MAACAMVGMRLRSSKNRFDQARLSSSRSQQKAVIKVSPCIALSPTLLTSVIKVSSDTTVLPARVNPNSSACLVGLTMSPPALASATTLAPDACACNRKALKSAVLSGWRALPNTFPPLATTALVADPSNGTPITLRLHAQSFKRSLAGCRPTSTGTGSGLAPEGGLSCRLRVKLRRTQYEHMFSALLSNSDIARCSRTSKVPTSDIADAVRMVRCPCRSQG